MGHDGEGGAVLTDHHVSLFEASDVDKEVLEQAWKIAEGWYGRAPVDWDDLWDRLDGFELEDGRMVDLGDRFPTPAMIFIKQTVLRWRREGR